MNFAWYAVLGFLIGLSAIFFSAGKTLGLAILALLALFGILKQEVIVISLAALLPFHLEWEMPQILGVKVGTTSLLVAAGLVSIVLNLFIDQKALPRIPHLVPWLLLAFFMCAAYIHSPYFIPDAAKVPWHLYRTVLRFLLIFPLQYILVKVKGEDLMVWMVLALLVSTSLTAIVGIGQTVAGVPWQPFHFGVAQELLSLRSDVQEINETTGLLRAFGSFTHSNAFAGFLVITASISAGIVFMASKGFLWCTALITALIQLLALVCTMSRGGWLAFTSSIILMAVLAKKKTLIAFGGVSLLVIMFSLPPAATTKFAVRVRSLAQPSEVGELAFRQERWGSFLAIARDNPLLGTGEASLNEPKEKNGQTPHNIYLFFAVKHGMPALFLLLYLFFLAYRKTLLAFRLGVTNWQRSLSLGLLGALAGLLVHGFVDATIGIDQIWTAFWVIFAIAMLLAENTLNMQALNQSRSLFSTK